MAIELDFPDRSLTSAQVLAALGYVPANSDLSNLNLALASLANADSDTAAAIVGVPVGGMYRNGSVLQVRVA